MRLAVSVADLRKDYVLSGERSTRCAACRSTCPRATTSRSWARPAPARARCSICSAASIGPPPAAILLSDVDVSQMSDDRLAEIRATRIGFIFQSYNLLPALTVVENIEVPLYYSHRINAATKRRCRELAEMVGLGQRLNHRPTQLSGGQQQRVAIARSLVNDPEFILADEPTGNLDSATTDEILDLLENLNRQGRTIIMVTHEPDVAERTKRSIHAARRAHCFRRTKLRHEERGARSEESSNLALAPRSSLLAPRSYAFRLATHPATERQEPVDASAALVADGAGHLHRRVERDLAVGAGRRDQPGGAGADFQPRRAEHHRAHGEAVGRSRRRTPATA